MWTWKEFGSHVFLSQYFMKSVFISVSLRYESSTDRKSTLVQSSTWTSLRSNKCVHYGNLHGVGGQTAKEVLDQMS